MPGRLLDMGCGFGKSTDPFAERFREAEVIGVDIAAPCLKLAARNAADSQRRNVRYLQRDATATGLDAASVDCVTSTMLLHEMPPKAIEAAFDEAHRVLRPGGRMVHLDFWALPDAFARFVHYGHSRRNNEPYMPPWAEMDVTAVLEAKGFEKVEVDAVRGSRRRARPRQPGVALSLDADLGGARAVAPTGHGHEKGPVIDRALILRSEWTPTGRLRSCGRNPRARSDPTDRASPPPASPSAASRSRRG